MKIFDEGLVSEILEERRGLQRIRLDSGHLAFVLTDLLPAAMVGDRVVFNSSAIELGLGTGGSHIVHWNLSRSSNERPFDGHIMKARYTSLQHPRLMIEEQYAEPSCDVNERLMGKKVLTVGLHSQVGVAAIAAKIMQPSIEIGYVMTDGGSLPIALSDLVYRMTQENFIHHTVTAGQSFGGDYNSVSVEGGVAACFEYLNCDLVIVGMGPGVAGSGTALGNSALECAGISMTLLGMGAKVRYAMRVSDADARERHRGVSHHSNTFVDLTTGRVPIVLPLGVAERIPAAQFIDVSEILPQLLSHPLLPMSMGRGPSEDEIFYAATLAAVKDLLSLDR